VTLVSDAVSDLLWLNMHGQIGFFGSLQTGRFPAAETVTQPNRITISK
jgi:hypothetical protein